MHDPQIKEKNDIPPLHVKYLILRDGSRLKEVSRVLDRAFFNYPMTHYLFPDARNRAAKLNEFYYNVIHQALHSTGTVIVATYENVIVGTLTHFPVAKSEPTIVQILTSRLALLPVTLKVRTILRILKIDSYLSQKRRQLAQPTDRYITFVAVDPNWQSKGISRGLIDFVVSNPEFARSRFFLETHKKENVALYQHLGFRLVFNETYPKGAPESSFMLMP